MGRRVPITIPDSAAIGHAYADAIEAGDIDRVADLLATDCAIWHNSDGLVVGRHEALGALSALIRISAERFYTQRRMSPTASGFVFESILVARAKDGDSVELPCCMICSINDGRIAAISEYVDPAPIRRWFAQALAPEGCERVSSV